MIAVVMQPTYLPWVGYFDLIDQADVFVFLDTVQFERQSWQQRNRIKGVNGPVWLTVPVFRSLKHIEDVRVDDHGRWRKNHWNLIRESYSRAPFFGDVGPLVHDTLARRWDRLVDLNVHLVTSMAQAMGVGGRMVRASELPPVTGRKGDMLVALCRSVGAHTYLSPAGSRAYLESDAAFVASGVRLQFHEYQHPVWPQLFGEFAPFMSALDLVMNVGYGPAADFVRAGRRPATDVTFGR